MSRDEFHNVRKFCQQIVKHSGCFQSAIVNVYAVVLCMCTGNNSTNVTCYCTECGSSDSCVTDGSCYAEVFRASESAESHHRIYG